MPNSEGSYQLYWTLLKDLEHDFVPAIVQKKGNAIANVSESLHLIWSWETSIFQWNMKEHKSDEDSNYTDWTQLENIT